MARFDAETWLAVVRGDRRGMAASLTRLVLRAASWPYGLGVRSRNALFALGWKSTTRAAVPVVSVGNLSLGGTGKTPCVEYVARHYRDRGVRAVILSRGYGQQTGRNDEALVLEENLPDAPHLQGADRAALAATAVEELEAELLVLDDGFQHRRLARDLDIVLIDATRPPARDYLFPRGTLREPAGSLRRAGAIVLTRCDQLPAAEVQGIRDWVARRRPGRPIATTEHAPMDLVGGEAIESLEALRGRPVAGFCGIGNPEAFRRTLESLGAEVVAFRSFPDHHPYGRSDVDDLGRWANDLPANCLIATTQKDWVKLRFPELAGRPVRAVRIGLAFRDGQPEFDAILDACEPLERESDDGE